MCSYFRLLSDVRSETLLLKKSDYEHESCFLYNSLRLHRTYQCYLFSFSSCGRDLFETNINHNVSHGIFPIGLHAAWNGFVS